MKQPEFKILSANRRRFWQFRVALPVKEKSASYPALFPGELSAALWVAMLAVITGGISTCSPAAIKRREVSPHMRLCSAAFLSVVLEMVVMSFAPAFAIDNVAGNLIQFNNDGFWSWYMDERVIHDPSSGQFLISSTSSSNFTDLRNNGGTVRVTSFDPATGTRRSVSLADIDEDDHNAGALLVLPNGKYLDMYSNHGTPYMGDRFSRWRVTNNPHDISSWTIEKTFDWSATPGWSLAPFANSGVSYHNLYYLSGEDRVYDFSRGTHMAMNTLLYDYNANSVTWSGQFEQSTVLDYGQGYFKFASNNVDKIYFIGDETHPYNFDASIYAGYNSGGKTYKMDGTLMDSNMFDNAQSSPGATVPYINNFTVVQHSDPPGSGYNKLWPADLALNSDGTLSAVYTGKFNDNDNDQRLLYARWDGTQWHTFEAARMGSFLYVGQEEYTGVAAVVPDRPNVLYVSTTVDPRDTSGATTTAKHEIYKGVTNNGGANWIWTAITSNSSVDNLRPIAQPGDGNTTLVTWFRGTYTAAYDADPAVVGIVDRSDAKPGLIRYVDATTSNTTRSNGTAIGNTTGTGEGAVDQQWRLRTDIGNSGVFSAGGAGNENAPALMTTISNLPAGAYDVFAYFWADVTNNWQIQVGMDPNNMMQVRDNGAQQAELNEFDPASGAMVLASGGASLYRTYVGRTSVLGGGAINVFVDDALFNASGATGFNRTWYDGVGYSLVTAILDGDYNGDGIVDAADYTVWRDSLGSTVDVGSGADGNRNGIVDQDDYVVWKNNFGMTAPSAARGSAVPEPATAMLLGIGLVSALAARCRRS